MIQGSLWKRKVLNGSHGDSVPHDDRSRYVCLALLVDKEAGSMVLLVNLLAALHHDSLAGGKENGAQTTPSCCENPFQILFHPCERC